MRKTTMKIKNTINNRITWIDIARGILIIFVVIGHVKSSYSSTGILGDSFIIKYSNTLAYTFHMATFFFVSGLLFIDNRHNKSLSHRIMDKLISYGIPYVIFSIVYYLIQLTFSSASNHSVNTTDILMIFIKPFSFLWFIYALMLMQIVLEVLKSKGKVFNLVIGITLFILNCILKKIFAESIYSQLIICDFMNFYMYFVIGVCLGKNIVSFISNLKKNVWISIGMFAVLAIGALLKMYFFNYIIGNVILACWGILTIIIVSLSIEKCKVLEYLGKQSLPIYLLHGYVISFARIVLSRLDLNKFGGGIPLVFCTISGIILSLLCMVIVERIPYMDFIFYPKKYLRKK